jgi:type II secretory pathway component GspD/PulD (secretin)
MKLTLLFTALISLCSSSIFAEELKCKTLTSCIDQVSSLSGRQYIIGTRLESKSFQEVAFKGSKEEIDKLLSQLLFNYGYTRIPSVDKSWMIISSRDIRYNPMPLLDSAKDEIPQNFDYIMVTHQLKNKRQATAVTRSFRPFMSRYGRIISLKDSGQIIMQDTGVNIKRLLGLVDLSDVEPTEEELREAKKRRKFNQRIQLLEAKNPKCVSTHK